MSTSVRLNGLVRVHDINVRKSEDVDVVTMLGQHVENYVTQQGPQSREHIFVFQASGKVASASKTAVISQYVIIGASLAQRRWETDGVTRSEMHFRLNRAIPIPLPTAPAPKRGGKKDDQGPEKTQVLDTFFEFNGIIRLTNEPTTREFGTSRVVKFGAAHNSKEPDGSGGLIERVDYLNCEAWNSTGDTIARYVPPGGLVYVSGVPSYRTWEDRETGKTRSGVDFKVLGVVLQPDGKTRTAATSGRDPNNGTDFESMARGKQPQYAAMSDTSNVDIPY